MFHNNTESFVSEECHICNVELTQTKDIFITLDSDQYICSECAQYHNIASVPCKEEI